MEVTARCLDETDIEFSFEDTIKMVQNTIVKDGVFHTVRRVDTRVSEER